MNDKVLVDAVRRVLPAVGLKPGKFSLERGFLARASRRVEPTVLALNNMTRLLVLLSGDSDELGPELAVAAKGEEALGALGETARTVCTHFIALWTSSVSDVAHAAAFMAPETSGLKPRLLGTSWTAPDSWPEPTVDPAGRGDDGLTRAIERLALLVDQKHDEVDFDVAFERQVALIDLELEYRGGHGQDVSSRPARHDIASIWLDWLKRYERSVRDEWFLITGARRPEPPSLVEPTADGPLSGVRVFLSYALPDETTLALPVNDALRRCGASVWFDRDHEPDAAWLNAGLADTIADCDAYVMCASDEFVERAGYATQEVAWALMHRQTGHRPIKLVVVAARSTVLPTIIAEWPLVELRSSAGQDLERRLSDALLAPPAPAPALHPPGEQDISVRLEQQADLVAMRERVKHLRRFAELPVGAVTALISGRSDGAPMARVRDTLCHTGDGLGWSGTLEDLADWPEDSLVRDLRWRLASSRAVVATREPLSDDVSDRESVAHDVELLTCRQLPLSDWDAVPGWAANERRPALRHHAGLLRALDGLLARGLYGGITSVSSGTLAAWARNLSARRVECHDALVDLRLRGELSWGGEPPTWDELFRAWSGLMRSPPPQWRDAAPGQVLLALGAAADDIAAVAAQTGWSAAYEGISCMQQFTFGLAAKPTHATICTSVTGSTREEPTTGIARSVELRLEQDRDKDPEVTLSWTGFEDTGQSGTIALPAPEDVRQAFSRSSA
jgi:hypothetical protein